MSTKPKLVIAYDSNLVQAMISFTEVLPVLSFKNPEINICWSGRKWVFTVTECEEVAS
ncbi:hypothetical protein [Psychrobacter sp. I-STPA6b]|uniref:hypothetical protein n=1 Tax=Psychrobacter sp. I-STPA6b TaxID=2585718 RepID=UPI001D0CBEBB|nr:hypothetical protein [Psychrobacter sp. I-STPA6b]